jgi:hypothetical protein
MLAKELASVGEAIRAAYTAREVPQRPARPPRPAPRPALRVRAGLDLRPRDGGVRVLLGGAVVVDDVPTPATAPKVQWTGTLTGAEGGKLGALHAMSRDGGIVDGFRAELGAVAGQLAARSTTSTARVPAASTSSRSTPPRGPAA